MNHKTIDQKKIEIGNKEGLKTIDNEELDYNDELLSINIRNLPKEYFVSNYKLFYILGDKFVGQDSLVVKYYENGTTKSTIHYALNNNGNISLLYFGDFKTYNEKGKPLEKGKYGIGRYIDCCGGGLCGQFYNFKHGEWEYYYPNGNKKALVNYQVKKFHIRTSCEGGDSLNFGQIDLANSNFWDINEKPIEPPKAMIKELETVVFKIDKYNSKSISIVENKLKQESIYKK